MSLFPIGFSLKYQIEPWCLLLILCNVIFTLKEVVIDWAREKHKSLLHKLRADEEFRNETVDVFITIVNEPIDIIEASIVSALNIEWSKKIYLLDDGANKKHEELAARLGVNYIKRTDRFQYKAGNINNALALTSSSYILILDADTIVAKDIIRKALQLFDETTWAIQFNGVPRNLDAISFPVNDPNGKWFDIKHGICNINTLANLFGVATWRGSGALIKRSCLEEIGGIKGKTTVEDTETSLEFLDKTKYKLKYIFDESCYSILDPIDHVAYLKQRTRWSLGRISIFFKYHLGFIFKKKLDFKQTMILIAYRNDFFAHLFKQLLILYAVTRVAGREYASLYIAALALLPFLEAIGESFIFKVMYGRYVTAKLFYDYYFTSITIRSSFLYLMQHLTGKDEVFELTPKVRTKLNDFKIFADINLPYLAFFFLAVSTIMVFTQESLNMYEIVTYFFVHHLVFYPLMNGQIDLKGMRSDASEFVMAG